MRHPIINHLILLAACALLPQAGWAQEEADYVSDDARTTGAVWTEVSLTKVLPYNLSLGVDAGFRTNDWFNEADRADISLGLDWKPFKHWKFGIGYTFMMKHTPVETAYKNATERTYDYRNPSTGLDESFSSLPSTIYSETADNAYYTLDDGTAYRYQGYTDTEKNYTRTTEAFWRAKHRIKLDAAYTYKFWKWFRVSLRERYQFTYVPTKTVNRVRTGNKNATSYYTPDYSALTDGDDISNSDTWDKITYDDSTSESSDAYKESEKEKSNKYLHTLRSRLTFEVDKKGWAWSPYVYVELFNDLASSMNLDKVRASIGVDYAITPQHKVGLGYVFNHENDDDGNQNIHAISVGYRFKF